MAENYPTNLKTDQQKNTYEFLKLEHSLCVYEWYCFHEWYLGALCALTNKNNPGRFSQAANSLREIMEKLVMHYLNINVYREARKSGKVKEFLEAIYPNNILNNTCDEFMNLRNELEYVTHHKLQEQIDESEFREFIKRFEEIILELNSLTKEGREKISILLKNRPKDNEELLSLAKLPVSNFMYFFKEIGDDETWFHILNENGFFSGASDDIRYSSSVLYLKKIAGKNLVRLLRLF